MSLGGGSAKRAAQSAQQTANAQGANILATNAASNVPLQASAAFASKAQTPLGQLLGYDGYDAQAGHDAVINDPGYHYGLQQAQANIDGSAAARGSLMSGQTIYNQADLGNRYYDAARQNAINNNMGVWNSGNSIWGQIANNNNAAQGNASSMITGGANNYAAQRQNAYNNNVGIFNNTLSSIINGASSAAGYSTGGS